MWVEVTLAATSKTAGRGFESLHSCQTCLINCILKPNRTVVSFPDANVDLLTMRRNPCQPARGLRPSTRFE